MLPPQLLPCTDFDAESAAYGQLRPRRSKPLRPSSSAAAPRLRTSPFHPSASAVPFSWEHRPGVPKAPDPLAAGSTARPLLPPPLRSAPIGIKGASFGSRDDDDPFAAALAECAKSPLGPVIADLFGRSGKRSRTPASAAGWSISDRLGLVGIHASCKAACAVVDSTVLVRRSGSSYGCLIRRAA